MNSSRSPLNQQYDQEQEIQERVAITNLKLGILIVATFGLIVGMYALNDKIEEVKGVKAKSYMSGGGIIFGLFIVYVILFGVKWFFGASKRQQLKRDAVQKQIAKQKALQARRNLQ